MTQTLDLIDLIELIKETSDYLTENKQILKKTSFWSKNVQNYTPYAFL